MKLDFNQDIMMTFQAKRAGFTLIELITVISIMAIVLSLVGPLTIKFIDKAQAQTEFITLKNNLKRISFLSFASATPHTLKFINNNVIVSKKSMPDKVLSFNYLNFNEQQLYFNSRGYTEPETLQVNFLNKNETINVFKLVEGVDAKIVQQ
jgi:prepilin-type N-terminal cleavage/methylation domain-containing protein